MYFQFFSGMAHFEPRLPCDDSQIGRFRQALGEAGVEQLLKTTIETAVGMKAVKPAEFDRVIVDSTVQEKAIAHPTDSRLLEGARAKIAQLASRAGIALKQSYAAEGKKLRRRAGDYAHARQFKRLRRVIRRQRLVLGQLLRDVQRKASAEQTARPGPCIERAWRIQSQRPKDKSKLYALHAPEAECVGKGKARQPFVFGVKVSPAVTHKSGLIVGARSFPGNPYHGHTLAGQIEQTTTLLQDIGGQPQVAVVDLGYRGVDHLVPPRSRASRTLQDHAQPAQALVQATTGHRTRHRTRQAGSRHAPLLAQGIRRRRAARRAVCRGVQHPMAATRHRSSRPAGALFALRGHAVPAGRSARHAQLSTAASCRTARRWRKVNFAGPTTYI